jgi:predicted metalloprotease with PDZ domain
MSDFFKRYVRGVEMPPYEEAFAQMGLRFVGTPRQPVSVGVAFDETDTSSFKIGKVRPNSPASDAGWEIGDRIVSVAGLRTTANNFLKIIARYKPGDSVNVVLQRGPRTIQSTIVMGEPQLMDYRIEEIKDASGEVKARRAAWMKGK